MAVQWPPWSGGGSGGGVTDVNGDFGPSVVLDAADVGAVASTTSANRLYGTTSAGNPSSFPYSQTAGVNTVAQRTSTGALVVSDPTAATHAVTRQYLESILADYVQSDGTVTDIVARTQAEYDALTPDATTHYLIDG